MQSTSSDYVICAADGFQAELRQSGDDYRLYIQLNLYGRGVGAQCVWEGTRSEFTVGEASRSKELAAAVCRYLNACGTWNDARELLTRMSTAFGDAEIDLPDGWRLECCSYQVPDPTVIFVNQQLGKALVVKHEIYSEFMTIAELGEQLAIGMDDYGCGTF